MRALSFPLLRDFYAQYRMRRTKLRDHLDVDVAHYKSTRRARFSALVGSHD